MLSQRHTEVQQVLSTVPALDLIVYQRVAPKAAQIGALDGLF